MTWDTQERIGQYRTRARNAESHAKKLKLKASKSETYKRLHDEALAEFSVFNQVLHDHGNLATPGQLITALDAMTVAEPEESLQAYDRETFARARLKEIDLLIRRIQLDVR